FVRASNNPFHWPAPWQPVIPGTAIAGQVVGRYVQIAVSFYPSADGEGSPYLKEVGLTFLRDEPPAPPSRLVAAALDGSVQLTWRQSPNQNVLGYLVYYGTSEGELFGEGAVLGPSPIHIGPENSVVIEGLQNGKLYFFRVAAYSEGTSPWFLGSSVPAPGEFSNEARARPLPR
ncbi:MAG: fibronectin type III domain-containing protein, partial [Treponema sp.]|nr:fibronectin type III domain-containing protein [Treponema sp.]